MSGPWDNVQINTTVAPVPWGKLQTQGSNSTYNKV